MLRTSGFVDDMMFCRVFVVLRHVANCYTRLLYLARSAKLPTGLYILLALIFFIFYLFLIYRRQIISGSAGPIFAIFSPNESVLGADDRSGPLFFDISRDVAMSTNFVKK